MPKRNYGLFITDIRDCSRRIMEYVKGKSFQDFTGNQMLMDAVIRNLEIIGEATKNIPSRIKQMYPKIEWKKIAGLRDMVIHQYFGIDSEILWDIVQHKIPELLENIEKMQDKEGKSL